MKPQVCVGTVMHARLRGEHGVALRHGFAYPTCFVALPLDAATEPGLWFARDRRAALSVHARDHGGRDGSDLAAWARQVLTAHGIDFADGTIVLQTYPRIFGLLFNPVSFWFFHDHAGALRAVIAEVNNTFGERHNYLLAHGDQRPILPSDCLTARKCFHVSPFFPVAGEYRFRFEITPQRRHVEIDYWVDGVRALATAIHGDAIPLNQTNARRVALRFPLLALSVLWRIHWQAWRLWRKGAPFFRKPTPPLQETTR